MQLDEIIDQLSNAFGRFSADMSNSIFRELGLSLRHLDRNVYWDTVLSQINSRLNSWLVQQAYQNRYPNDLNKARMVLECVEDERFIPCWLNEIRNIYAPIAWEVYSYRVH